MTVQTVIDQATHASPGVADSGGRFVIDSGQPVTLDCRMRVLVDAPSINRARSDSLSSGISREPHPGGFVQMAFGYTVSPRGGDGQLVLLPLNDPGERHVSVSIQVTDRIRQAAVVWMVDAFVAWPRDQSAYLDLLALTPWPNSAASRPDPILAGLGQSLAEVRLVTLPGSVVMAFAALLSTRSRGVATVLLPTVLGLALWGALGGHGFSPPPTLWGFLNDDDLDLLDLRAA